MTVAKGAHLSHAAGTAYPRTEIRSWTEGPGRACRRDARLVPQAQSLGRPGQVRGAGIEAGCLLSGLHKPRMNPPWR